MVGHSFYFGVTKPCRQCRSQKRGGGNFKLVMIQSSHWFGIAASSLNLSESSLAGWAPVLRLRSHPPNRIQTNLAPRGEKEPVGLIESFGSAPDPVQEGNSTFLAEPQPPRPPGPLPGFGIAHCPPAYRTSLGYYPETREGEFERPCRTSPSLRSSYSSRPPGKSWGSPLGADCLPTSVPFPGGPRRRSPDVGHPFVVARSCLKSKEIIIKLTLQ